MDILYNSGIVRQDMRDRSHLKTSLSWIFKYSLKSFQVWGPLTFYLIGVRFSKKKKKKNEVEHKVFDIL